MCRKEILKIAVTVNGAEEVKGKTGEAVMIRFGGTCDTEFFHGKILAGGVDTQQERYPDPRAMSARYMLEGTDYAGQTCRIFIENLGTPVPDAGDLVTRPAIFTDSEALSWLETAHLSGLLTPMEGGLYVHIFAEEADVCVPL